MGNDRSTILGTCVLAAAALDDSLFSGASSGAMTIVLRLSLILDKLLTPDLPSKFRSLTRGKDAVRLHYHQLPVLLSPSVQPSDGIVGLQYCLFCLFVSDGIHIRENGLFMQ